LPNDNCEGAIQAYPPETVNGTTIGATIDCPGYLDWPAVWYKVELPYDCNNLFVDFCPMTIDLGTVGAVIFDECPPDCAYPIYYTSGAFVDCPNGTYNAQIWYRNLPQGMYWIPIYVEDLNYNAYLDFSVSFDVEECVQLPGDVCATAIVVPSLPYNATGNSCDYNNDYDEVCPYTGSTAPDLVFSYSPTANQAIDVLLCPSLYDTKVYVYEDACVSGTFIDCNDDACGSDGWKSAIYGLNVYAGHTYYVVVDGYGTSCGTYDLTIREAVICDVVCPAEGIPEGEPICYDGYIDNYNGGCNSDPYVFQDINCNTIICGTSGVYDANYNRDTDWFRFQVSEGTLTWKVVAEFPVLIFIIAESDCANPNILGSATAPKCDTAVLSMYVAAGVYWLWVGPSDWGNYPCGLEYVGIVECTGLGPQISVTPSSFDVLLNPGRTKVENMFISNTGSEDLNFDISWNLANLWLNADPRTGTVPPGNTATIDVTFDATVVGVGDYYDDLTITSNAPKQPGTVIVPVHLKVEEPPDIDVPSPVSVGVLPGCSMEKGVRVDNLGTGELRFEVEVSGAPPKVAGASEGTNVNRVPNRKMEDFFKAQTNLGDKSNLMAPTASAPAEASKVNTPSGGPKRAAGSKADVIWDNGGDTGYAYASQLDLVYPFDAQVADDFILSANYNITDVHWWGAFWNGPPDEVDPCDFYIYIYADDGSGNQPTGAGMAHPGVTALATYFFSQITGYPLSPNGNYEYNVTLSPPFGATGGVKYWIAVQAVFPFQPQWGWVNTDGVQLHTAVQGFPLIGNPFWTLDTGADMAFYLTGESPCPMTVSPASGTVPPGGHTEVALTFDGTAFAQCPLETDVTCYLVFTSNDPDEPVVTSEVDMWSGRGDVFIPTCVIDLGDVVYLVNYVYKSGPPPNPVCMGDCAPSHDGWVDNEDVVYLIQYLYQGGLPPLLTPEIH